MVLVRLKRTAGKGGTAMMAYLRTQGKFNVYEFECPHCHIRGEVGVPIGTQQAFDHGCGSKIIYIQRPAAGMFTHPRLEEIHIQTGGVA
jgi:hypothetical protein